MKNKETVAHVSLSPEKLHREAIINPLFGGGGGGGGGGGEGLKVKCRPLLLPPKMKTKIVMATINTTCSADLRLESTSDCCLRNSSK